jgi:ATP-binding protein involved in chromosome partitioning
MFGLGKKGDVKDVKIEEKDVLAALGRIQDPDLRRDIVSLGFVKDLQIERGAVSFKIELTTPACPVKGEMERMAREYVGALPGVEKVDVSMTSQVRSTAPPSMSLTLPGVRNVIAVASG